MKKPDQAFWDTSAVVPLCCHQTASAPARLAARSYRTFVVWWGTPVESFNTFARLLRERYLTQAQFTQACRKLAVLRPSWVEIAPTDQVREQAEQVLLNHALSTADGLQLAAALVWCGGRPRNRPVVCADGRLAAAAEKMGFQVRLLPA